jgi:hypothetical protein
MFAMTDPASPPPASPPPPSSSSSLAPPAWQPPAWQPPPRQRGSNLPTILVGLVFLVIGIWYFLDTTLGLTMPDIEWDNFWPIILIVIGGVIVFRAATDRDR